MLRSLIASLLLISPALAEPEGYYGDGHDKWHHIYSTLHNTLGTSCCDDQDCRPTTAKFEDGHWYAKVDGEWTLMKPNRRSPEAPLSWSATAHVCADGTGYVFCFVPPGAGT